MKITESHASEVALPDFVPLALDLTDQYAVSLVEVLSSQVRLTYHCSSAEEEHGCSWPVRAPLLDPG